MDSNIYTHLRMLVKLALSDQKFSDIEQGLIMSIGKAHQVTEKATQSLIKEELKRNPSASIAFQSLTFNQKFQYLYDIIQLMKIDNEVYLSEIRFCEQMADRLGFDKGVIKKLSGYIYSDPSITADRGLLVTEARKYLKD